jgi:hypothetical protein
MESKRKEHHFYFNVNALFVRGIMKERFERQRQADRVTLMFGFTLSIQPGTGIPSFHTYKNN